MSKEGQYALPSEYELDIDQEFRELCPALSSTELEQLEENIVSDGRCHDPIICWGDIIIDGHNRYGICCKHNIRFSVMRLHFTSREDVIDWIINRQLGRRNIDANMRKYLIGKRRIASEGSSNPSLAVAAESGVADRTVRRAAAFTAAVDRIGKTAPQLKAEILSGKVKAPHKAVVALSEAKEKAVKTADRESRKNGIISAPPKNSDQAAIETEFRLLVKGIDERYNRILALYESMEEFGGEKEYDQAVAAITKANRASQDAADLAHTAFRRWRESE